MSDYCRIGDTSLPDTLVWGDSHALALLPAFDATLSNLHRSAFFAAESGCPPLIETTVFFHGQRNWRCAQQNAVLAQDLRHDSIHVVVLVGAWTYYYNSDNGYSLYRDGLALRTRTFPDALQSTVVWLQQHGKQVVIVSQVPAMKASSPFELARAIAFAAPLPPAPTREGLAAAQLDAGAITQALGAHNDVAVLDPVPWFCATSACAVSDVAGHPLYRDTTHLSVAGAHYITPSLQSALANVLPPNPSAARTGIGH